MKLLKSKTNGTYRNGYRRDQAAHQRAMELYDRMRARFDAGIITEVNYDELEEYAKQRKRFNHWNYRGPRTITLSKKV